MFRWLSRMCAAFTYRAPDVPPPPIFLPEPISPPTTNTVLRAESRHPYFPFEIHLHVRYALRDGAAVADPLLIAQAGIGRRLQPLARALPLTEVVRLRQEIELSLSQRHNVDSTGVVAWASCIAVQADERLVEVIRRYEALRRHETSRAWTREDEEAEIAHLSRLLEDPRRATAWWFTRHTEDVSRLPEVADTFVELRARLSEPSAAGDSDDWDKIFRDFQSQAGPADRHMVDQMISRLFQRYELPDLAARARNLDGYPAAD